jgi:Ca-activated chloride channel family protein
MLRASFVPLVLIGFTLATFAGCGSQAVPSGDASSPAGQEELRQIDATARYAAPASTTTVTAGETTSSAPAAESPPAEGALLGGAGLPTPAPQVEADFSRPVDQPAGDQGVGPGQGGDKFAYVEENRFLAVKDSPLSTFSIDVDTASYSKTRAYLLEHHSLPPPDAVRIEELVNYFAYDYAGPTDEHPFAVHIESAECPWQPKHRLVRFGIQGKRIDQERPVSNLVFLIDVSGSMNQPNKLPLVKRSLGLLVRQLGENDKVAMVVYAGAAGLVLPPTSGTDQPAILNAIENLSAGGSTNGGAGIHLAYQLALDNFIKGGVNRVILCTDGDFNVGTTSTGDLVRLAEEKSKAGVYLSILGYGFGNHNDDMLEQVSNRANGNYAFIDSDMEAQKVLVEQMQGTLVTIAKDVKIQIEFNPAQVAAYRLIGYENRRLADRDFNDDAKDAGDIGAGHSVTALYEIVPPGVETGAGQPEVDPLKYQGSEDRGQGTGDREQGTAKVDSETANELLTLKLRYQPPAGGKSTLLTFPVKDGGAKFGAASADFQFASAVASFGMLLRNSQHKGDTTYGAVLETASAARGEDQHGLRGEFLELVKAAQRLSGEKVSFASPAWRVPYRAHVPGPVVIGAPRVGVRPAAYLPRPATTAPPLLGLKTEHIFALGLLAGAALAVVGVLMGLGLLSLRSGRVVEFAPPPAPGKKSVI